MPLIINDGSSWQPLKKASVYDGTSWNDAKSMSIYNGTEWVPIESLIPESTVAPTFTWSAGAIAQGVGQTVTVSNGEWTNGPVTNSYEWFKAPYTPTSSPSWQSVGTTQSLELTADFVGHFLKCTVSATNSYGTGRTDVTITYTVLSPQKLTTFRADFVSNGVFDLVFDKPIGADSWYLQYQGPNVSYFSDYFKPGDDGVTSFTENSKTMYKYRLDTGYATSTLGLGLWPTNSDNPIKNVIPYLQGDGKNETILDLKPNKPSVTLVAYSPGIAQGTLFWTPNNITQTGYGTWWTSVGTSHADMTGVTSVTGPLGSASDRFAYLENLSDGETYGYKVRVYGTADRFYETYWDSAEQFFTTESYPIPAIVSAPVVSVSGTTASSTSGSWTNTPTSFLYAWYIDGSPIFDTFTSSLDVSAYSGSTVKCRVYATNANNKTGEADSNTVTIAAQAVIPSGGSVTLTGGSTPGSYIYAESPIGGWNGDPDSVSVIITTYVGRTPLSTDRIVAFSINSDSCSYQITELDAASPPNIFKAFAVATNSAGSSTEVGSGTITAQTTTPTPPSFPYFPYFPTFSAGPSFPYFPTFTASVTYYIGTSGCDVLNGYPYVSAPAVSGPYTAASMPADTLTGSGRLREKTVYRSTSAEALAAAEQGACAYVAPFFPFFPPSFPYFPYFPTFSASPSFPYFPTFSASPSFPYFPTFSASPTFPYFKAGKVGCIGSTTLILTENNGWVQANSISVGDTLLTVNPDDFGNGDVDSIEYIPSNVRLVPTTVVSVEQSFKTVYSFNNEDSMYSGAQPIFVKENDYITFKPVEEISVGDTIITIDEIFDVTETIVESIEAIPGHDVYDIRTEEYPWYIAGNRIVIS